MVSKPHYTLSKDADWDILEIARYTIENFGVEQAKEYRRIMLETFQSLAENPFMGRSAAEYGRDYRRYVYKSHVIFYRPVDNGIFIVRILGGQMDIPNQFLEH